MFSRILPVSLTMALALSSCAPKDEKINRPDNRGSGGGASTQNFTNNDALKHVAISLDKQVEALHLLKAVLDSGYAEQKKLKIETLVETEQVVQKSIVADLQEGQGATKINLVATIKHEEGQLKSVEILGHTGANSQELKATNSTNDNGITVNNKLKKIAIFKSKTEGSFDIKTESYEEVNSKKNGKAYSFLIGETELVWDGTKAGLDTALKLKIKKLEHMKPNQNTTWVDGFESNLTVQLNDCVSLSGSATLDYKKKKFDVVFDDSAIITNGAVVVPAAKCESRPVVDLRKLQ